ncbi:MAG TPA: hypothetical protein VMS60_07770 [Solirubrobacterales bacterium]|nr:hypothetical protein [Solirubrobacterales bacterium]
MASESKTLCMVGLPNTGKTTFLTAFFVATENGEGKVKITRYSDGDREHLNKMMERLAECEEVIRTSEQEPKELRLMVSVEDGPEERLVVPDMSGELVERGMASRRLNDEFAGLTIESGSVLMFLRADRLVAADPVQDFSALMRLVDSEADGAEGEAPATPDDWEIGVAPTQVRLVDVVQELLHLRNDKPLRLGLIISAWDQTSGELSPRDWVVESLPLLVQLLDALPTVTWTVFGVSAQGGTFETKKDREDLEDVELLNRPIVKGRDGSASTVLAPVCWALEM